MAMFADVTAEFASPTMIEECERVRPDLVIYEGSTHRSWRGGERAGDSRGGVRDCSGQLHLWPVAAQCHSALSRYSTVQSLRSHRSM